MGFFRDLKDNLNETSDDFDKNGIEKNADNMKFHTSDTESAPSAQLELARLAASLAKEAELSLDTEYPSHFDSNHHFNESQKFDRISNMAVQDMLADTLSIDRMSDNNISVDNVSVDHVVADKVLEQNPSNEESKVTQHTEQSVLSDSDENVGDSFSVPQENEFTALQENHVIPSQENSLNTSQENSLNTSQENVSVIAKDMSIKGELDSQGSIELRGCVVGNVVCMEKLTISGTLVGDVKTGEMFAENAHIQGNIESTGSVKIGHKTIIVGNICATSAVIAGAVKGDIDVHGPVIIASTAIVLGDIKSESVQVNKGATIQGCCSLCYADFKPTDIFEDFIKFQPENP